MIRFVASLKRSAFTLVELLVVIGIIGLLIAILMPVLVKARRAAQNTQCVSNLAQIGNATLQYRADAGRLPLFFMLRTAAWGPVPQNGSSSAIWWTAFSLGGKTTHPQISRCYMDDGDKPLNKYLYKDCEPGSYWNGSKANDADRKPRDVFRCPADTPAGYGAKLTSVGQPLNYLCPTVPSPFEVYGTDYMVNRGFMYDKQIEDLYYKIFTGATFTYSQVDNFNKGVSKIVMSWNSQRTYLAADMLFIWSIFYNQAIPGAHSSQPIHNAVFMDGHVAPAYVSAKDVSNWGSYIPGQYFPKSGDDWQDSPNATGSYYQGGPATVGKNPWVSPDPFGGANTR